MRNFILSISWPALLHSILFGLFWMSNRPFHRDVNGFLEYMLGRPMQYVAIFLGFSLVILISSLAMILGVINSPEINGGLVVLGWLYAALGVVYIVFFYGSFVMLFRQNPVQLARLGQFWWFFRLLSDAVLLLVLAWILGRWLFPVLSGMVGSNWARFAGLGLLFAGWLVPVVFPPGSVYRGSLPVKPLLIAHRGAAWLAPENTLAAMDRAVEIEVYGLESDVHISRDGVLFLMHDANLKQTTDVAELFPGRESDHASQFTWEELSQLNAGAWFTEEDPYQTIANGLTSPAQAAAYAGEGIPRLEAYLELASQHGEIVLYDLYDPPEGHPYHGLALETSLDKLEEAQLGPHAWILAGQADIPQIRLVLPEATLSAGIDSTDPPEAERLAAQGYRVVNSEYSLSDREIQAYKRAGLWVNLYTVDESWQFSRAWLLGADSVTSNNTHTLQALEKPVLGLTFWMYLGIWLVVGLLATVFVWGKLMG